MSTFALTGATIFDGERIIEGHAVVVAEGRVADVCSDAALPPGIERRRIAGLLAPGFIDVQVNGGGGVLFNDAPDVETIRAIGAAHRRFGTTGFLPTLISDVPAKMAAAVAAVRAGLEAGVPGLLGVHLEGPFFNPARKGVHDPRFIRAITDEDVAVMTSLGRGRTLVTLAPEMVPVETIARLAGAGVIVAAGHTEAPHEVLARAQGSGLRGYTHLYNAMPPLQSRAPGPVGAALDDRDAFASIIADMHHVSAPALRIALRAKGPETVMLITDAMPTVGTAMSRFDLQGRTILRKGGVLTTEDGTLAGSDLDMASAVRNAVTHLGVDLAAALRMASRTPAAFLGLDGELGRIAPGYRASMVLLDAALVVQRTWIDGEDVKREEG